MLNLTKNYFYFLLAISALSLGFAYITEFVFHIKPCPLCVYSRFPYLVLSSIAIVGMSDAHNKKKYLLWIVLALLASVLIGIYHSGIERGVFEMSAFCKPAVQIADNISVQDFLKILDQQQPAMCNKAELVVFALSMAEWNLLLNLFLLTMSSILLMKR